MHIKEVRSNLKRGVNAKLGARTLVTGPNGSGKTSIQNAIELALLGFASDVEGRAVVKKGDMLAKLGPPGDTMYALAVLDDGREARWSISPSKRGVGFHEPEHQPLSGLRVVFPVQEVREVLTGSPDALRMWLMSRVGANAGLQDVLNSLAAKHLAMYKDRSGRVRRGAMTEVDTLLAVIDAAYTEARSLNAEAKSAKAVIDTMSEGLGPEPYEEDLQKAQQAADHATDALREAQARPSGGMYQQAQEAARIRLRDLTEQEARLQQLRAAAPPLHPAEQKLAGLRRDIAAVCRATADLKSGTCLACGAPVAQDVAARAKRMEEDNLKGAAALRAHQAIEEQAVRTEEARRSAAEATRVEQALASAASVSRAAVDWIALTSAVDQTKTALVNLQNTQRQWRTLRAAKDQAQKALDTAQNLKSFAEDAEGVVETLLQRAAAAFESSVQAHLPPSDEFRILLLDGKKTVCRVGLMRRGVLHTALSGAEWARLTLALGCATFRPDENTLAIFIPEERAFDPDTLARVMSALDNAPGQVLLQSPVPPSPDRMPSGWSHIDLSP